MLPYRVKKTLEIEGNFNFEHPQFKVTAGAIEKSCFLYI
jgi:hypothetical protein